MWNKATDKCVLELPMFYWQDKDYPDYKIAWKAESKDQLRYLRNLIYEKHGYKFKDKKLQTLLRQFQKSDIGHAELV